MNKLSVAGRIKKIKVNKAWDNEKAGIEGITMHGNSGVKELNIFSP